MTIEIPPCGPHCGISAAREGHCDCELCHDGTATVVITRSDLLTVVLRASMCDQWYAGIGDYRPWQVLAPDCLCPTILSAHRLPAEHAPHCPVRQHHDRELLASLTGPRPLVSEPWVNLETLTCPQCGDRTFLDAADPDDDLEAFWHHLGQHTQDQLGRLRLWTTATGARS